MVNEQGYEQVNSKVYLGPTDSKVDQIPIGILILALQGLLPTLNLITEGDLSFDILFWVRHE